MNENFCKIEYHTLIWMLFDIWCVDNSLALEYIQEIDLEDLIKQVPNNEIFGEFRLWLLNIRY